jgi:hypothetical protein
MKSGKGGDAQAIRSMRELFGIEQSDSDKVVFAYGCAGQAAMAFLSTCVRIEELTIFPDGDVLVRVTKEVDWTDPSLPLTHSLCAQIDQEIMCKVAGGIAIVKAQELDSREEFLAWAPGYDAVCKAALRRCSAPNQDEYGLERATRRLGYYRDSCVIEDVAEDYSEESYFRLARSVLPGACSDAQCRAELQAGLHLRALERAVMALFDSPVIWRGVGDIVIGLLEHGTLTGRQAAVRFSQAAKGG